MDLDKQFKSNYVTRDEWESSERQRKEKEAAAFSRECDQREFLHELKKDVKESFASIRKETNDGFNRLDQKVQTVLTWQEQFKGGFKLIGGIIAIVGALGVVWGFVKSFWRG